MNIFRNRDSGEIRLVLVREPETDGCSESWVWLGETFIPGWRPWQPGDAPVPHVYAEKKVPVGNGH